MIRVRDLHKSYGSVPLFKGIHLSVAKGEAVACIGPSGSGKSTFLRCINGLEFFEEGEIDIDGLALHSIDRKRPSAKDREILRKVRLKIGMVFQQFNLFPHMTVMENIIEAPTRVMGIEKGQATEQAQELLRRINLEGKVGSYPGELSGGEQQRVAIARALAMKPEAMLFDEPTSSLDPETVGEVLAVIRDLVNEGMTTVIATHEMDFAREISDRVAVFDKGEIVEIDSPDNIFSNPGAERTRLFLSRVLKSGPRPDR